MPTNAATDNRGARRTALTSRPFSPGAARRSAEREAGSRQARGAAAGVTAIRQAYYVSRTAEPARPWHRRPSACFTDAAPVFTHVARPFPAVARVAVPRQLRRSTPKREQRGGGRVAFGAV